MSDFSPIFPTPVVVLVLGIAVAFACYREFRRGARRLRPAWLAIPALLSRLGALAVLGYLLMNPSRSQERQIPASKPLILIDGSDSMSLGTADFSTRWEQAMQFAEDAKAELDSAEVRVFSNEVSESSSVAEAEASGGLTRYAPTLEKVLSPTAEVYDPIILVSDGRPTDRGDLGNALMLAQQRGVTLGARVVGDDTLPRNAAIASVIAPEMIRARSRIGIKVALDVTGFSDEETITLEVHNIRDEVVATREIPANSGAPVSLSFDSDLSGGTYRLDLKQSGAEEISLTDNSYTFDVEVAARKIRVLMVEGTHVKRSVGTMGHSWNDLRLLTAAWDSSGEIDYELLTATSEYANEPNLYGVSLHNGEMKLDISRTFPKTREELYQFDVMMISDIPVGNFSEEQMQWVVDWVTERGAGFLMAGGYRTFDVGHYDETPWEKIIPVDMLQYGEGFSEQSFTFEIPKAVANHPLWTLDPDPEVNKKILAAHPNFTGMNRIRRAKPGALVLAERTDAPGEPVIAAQNYGRGRSVAFMPDLNGGWARYYVGWGPEGGPVQGAHTELGHGAAFKFKEAAARIPEGPAPPHPAPYYGRYWVNMVNWLGAKSVRWRDDDLAGRVAMAHATPGKTLPVSAEVLAAIAPDRVPDLEVAARLDLPGSSRVRLEYDRDRREYLGELAIPADLTKDQLSVIFEAHFDGRSTLDQVKVSVQQRNPEYLDATPDQAFLEELVAATGGKLVNSPEEAVAFAREITERRAVSRTEKNAVPLWDKWPVWALFLIFLGAEWLLRRNGHRAAGALAVFLFGMLQFPMDGQELAEPDLPALIQELGAERVRLRDEAEAKLREMPKAYEALRKVFEESENEELRLRAGHVIESLKAQKWQLVAELPSGNSPGEVVRGLAVSPEKKRAYTRCKNMIAVWDLENLEMIIGIPNRTGMWGGWLDDGPTFVLDLSPDGKSLIATDSLGAVYLYDVEDGKNTVKKLRRPATELDWSPSRNTVLWFGEFFPSGKKLMTGATGGEIDLWDVETGVLETTIPFEPTAPGRTMAAFAAAITPDEKHLVVSFDEGSPLDHIRLWSFESERWVSEFRGPRMSAFQFGREGRSLIAAGRDGGLYQFQLANGGLTEGLVFLGLGSEARTLLFAPDEQSAFVGLDSTEGEIVEVDLKSGEILWRSSPMGSPVTGLAWLSDKRFLALHASGILSIWEK